MRNLSLSILDLVQNSVRHKASLVEISVTHNVCTNLLTIDVKDNGCGMDKAELEMVIDPFYTTCASHKVGLGLPLFVQRALLTDGGYKFSSEKGRGTEVSAWFNTDSIDFVPLGDMKEAIYCLVISAPDVDFIYKFCNNTQCFTLDTKAVFDKLQVESSNAVLMKAAVIKEYLANEIIQ